MMRRIAYLLPYAEVDVQKTVKALEHMGVDALYVFTPYTEDGIEIDTTIKVVRIYMRPRRDYDVNAAKAIKAIVSMHRGDIVILNAEVYMPGLRRMELDSQYRDKIVFFKTPDSAKIEMPMWIPTSRYLDLLSAVKNYSGGGDLSRYIMHRIKDFVLLVPQYISARGYTLINGMEVYSGR